MVLGHLLSKQPLYFNINCAEFGPAQPQLVMLWSQLNHSYKFILRRGKINGRGNINFTVKKVFDYGTFLSNVNYNFLGNYVNIFVNSNIEYIRVLFEISFVLMNIKINQPNHM